MTHATTPIHDLGPAITEGDWAGWSTWTGSEPFEEATGPFYAKREADGGMVAGCFAKPLNMNGAGRMHGGAILTFADYSLFMISYDHTNGIPAVTVTLNSEFLSSVALGARLIARGEVLKTGKSLVFVRGLIEADRVPALSFSGVVKLLRTQR